MSGQSKLEKGTDYEHFVQAIYQTLLKADGVENIAVHHNVKLSGKSGCDHQIDVYWEFKVAGQLYKTAIECKAFNKDISIGRIRDFYGVLIDVPNLNGIFATVIGYQSGAKRYADHYGIALKELRFPTEEDWEGRIKDVIINIHVLTPHIREFKPRPTQKYMNTLSHPAVLTAGLWTHDPILFDEDGAPVASHEDLRRKLPTEGAPFEGKTHSVSYPDHILKVNGHEIPITGIDFIYDVSVEIITSTILGEEMAHAIIRDVKSGTYTFIDKKGSVR